uniref:Uncharacterized protein n=1 Tax=Anguilla anguilla TaxID=7936 RepID=A0A0E9WWK3_ANGAN
MRCNSRKKKHLHFTFEHSAYVSRTAASQKARGTSARTVLGPQVQATFTKMLPLHGISELQFSHQRQARKSRYKNKRTGVHPRAI